MWYVSLMLMMIMSQKWKMISDAEANKRTNTSGEQERQELE
jgi:hypothetical protein